MPFHIVRRHKTGSLSDEFNNGRLGQFRSIENARGAYADQINKERRAQMRWRHEQEVRMDLLGPTANGEDLEAGSMMGDADTSTSLGHHHSASSRRPSSAMTTATTTSRPAIAPPIVVRDIFGNVSALVPKRTVVNNLHQLSASSSYSSIHRQNNDDDGTIATPVARDTHFIVLPKQGYLPSNIPLTTSSIAAAGGSGIAPRNGGWNFNYHRRDKNDSSVVRSSSSSSLPNINKNNNFFSSSARTAMRPVDSDDDDAVSIASTTLSRKQDRDLLKARLSELQNEIANGSQQRQKLEDQIDELKDLILNFKKEESEKKRLVGTFGNLEAPTKVTFRAQRAPGIKTGMSGFASSRKQDPKLVFSGNQ